MTPSVWQWCTTSTIVLKCAAAMCCGSSASEVSAHTSRQRVGSLYASNCLPYLAECASLHDGIKELAALAELQYEVHLQRRTSSGC